MKPLHPVDIAKEIKPYPFFSTFDESLLMQLATMVRTKSFNLGDEILKEGQKNNKLFFLRKGEVDLMVSGERVGTLSKVGEVMGDMSVFGDVTVVATLIAKTQVDCFIVSTDDFAQVQPIQKDRFQFLLYKIYSTVLTERLAATNEKAKLFEEAARELKNAKSELQALTGAQMNFLRKEAEKESSIKKIAFLDSDKKNHSTAKMAIGGTGVPLECFTDSQTAEQALKTQKQDVVFCDIAFAEAAQNWKKGIHFDQLIMMAPAKMDFQQYEKAQFSNNFITRAEDDRIFNIKSLLSSLNKALNPDFFGIEKYLNYGCDVKELSTTKSSQRSEMCDSVLSSFKVLGVRSSILDRCRVSIEEMLMNAIYDAPVDSTGNPLYNHLPRSTAVNLNETQRVSMRFGCDGIFAAISVRDPFGSLKKETLFKYLKNNYSGSHDPHEGERKGGAGRGLHQIIESADLTVFNVQTGKATEVICLWNIDNAIAKKETHSSFHYFFR